MAKHDNHISTIYQSPSCYIDISKKVYVSGEIFLLVYDGGDLKAYSKGLNASISLISWWMIFSCMYLIDWKRTSIRLTTLAPMWIQATPMHLNEIKCWLEVQMFPEDDLIHVYTVYLFTIIFVWCVIISISSYFPRIIKCTATSNPTHILNPRFFPFFSVQNHSTSCSFYGEFPVGQKQRNSCIFVYFLVLTSLNGYWRSKEVVKQLKDLKSQLAQLKTQLEESLIEQQRLEGKLSTTETGQENGGEENWATTGERWTRFVMANTNMRMLADVFLIGNCH